MANDWKAKYAAIRKRLESLMDKAGLTVESVQVSSRPDIDSDWNKIAQASHVRFELKRNGHTIHTGYYSAGIGHTLPDDESGLRKVVAALPSSMRRKLEGEHFKTHFLTFVRRFKSGQKGMTLWEGSALVPVLEAIRAKWKPEPVDVVQSMLMDATGESFESWCSESGMDTDSRKAIATWEACRESERVMRSAFGRAYDKAQELAREF